MENYHIKALLLFFMVSANTFCFSQSLSDSNEIKPEYNDSHYKWIQPVYQSVNVDSIKSQRDDYIVYLKSIELLEEKLQSNRKELKMLTNQANDEVNIINNERKYLAEKRKFAKDDEKYLKTEKSLRDKEAKQLVIDRKELKKLSKELSANEMNERLFRLDEKDRNIKELENQWTGKRNELKRSLNSYVEKESELNRREVEVRNYFRELDRTKASLDLKTKQLALEKKQTKLELKKSKELLKGN